MPGYPNLFPTGFVENEKDSCEGPILYRSQPNRETPGIVELNDVINKYGNSQYKGGDFMRLANNLKNTTRMWERLPVGVKRDFIDLIINSNSGVSKDIIEDYLKKQQKKVQFSDKVEYFGEDTEAVTGSEAVNGVGAGDNKMSIMVVIVIAIVSIVIGFLISCSANSM